ncbi:MAG: hypothetical protein H6624_17595 [Bdellovibrionaceae bacterium]|nr:hypothetical protein [Bdellovibrionales bacterium]MCB9086159.1 hypothetical protein [Pseudobdellovibrionaceae bacterium]
MPALVLGDPVSKWVRSYRVDVTFAFNSKADFDRYLQSFPIENYHKIREINRHFKKAGLLLDFQSEKNFERLERNLSYRFLSKTSYERWRAEVQNSGAFSFSEAQRATFRFELAENKIA